MDKAEFFDCMKDFAYGFVEPRLLEDDCLTSWYKYFKEYRLQDFRKAVDRMVTEETKRPSLAELLDRVKRIQSIREQGERSNVRVQ